MPEYRLNSCLRCMSFTIAEVKTWDVIIVGGGIIGLSLAIALRKRGATVLVVERGEPGREASSAAGGMLVDSPLETPPPLLELASASARMYPRFAHEIEVESGMRVDLREHGTILFVSEEHIRHPALATPSVRPTAISPAELRQLEPALGQRQSDKAELGQDSDSQQSNEEADEFFRAGQALQLKERSIDPRALSRAAFKAAQHLEADFSAGDEVTTVEVENGGASGVKTVKTAFAARHIVNCAGAWAGSIAPVALPTRPVKGQMLCLVMQPGNLLRHVIRTPDVYLIPRSDGRLLVGATVEEAGFDKRTDTSAIQGLHRAALSLVPRLADAKILEDWAGLRPGTRDNLPILGETHIPGYYIATGHFRDGILLAPITAQVMADVIEGRGSEYSLAPFSPSRFSLRHSD